MYELFFFLQYSFFSKPVFCIDKPAQNVLVICNPYAGSKSSRNIYNIKIRPFFERARYNITYLGNEDYNWFSTNIDFRNQWSLFSWWSIE